VDMEKASIFVPLRDLSVVRCWPIVRRTECDSGVRFLLQCKIYFVCPRSAHTALHISNSNEAMNYKDRLVTPFE